MLEIYTIPVTPFAQNARILYDPQAASAVIVDPGGEVDLLLSAVKQLEVKELRVLLTHAHIDHAGGTSVCLSRAKAEFGFDVPLLAHPDSTLRTTIQRQAKLFGLPTSEYLDAPEPHQPLNEGDTFVVGSYSAKVFWIPGHAPDHLALFFDVQEFTLHEGGAGEVLPCPVVLAGDTLFAGSIGRTDLPGGNLSLLLEGIREKLFTLPDDTIVLCGHGPSTVIGEEKQFNPFLG